LIRSAARLRELPPRGCRAGTRTRFSRALNRRPNRTKHPQRKRPGGGSFDPLCSAAQSPPPPQGVPGRGTTYAV
jgi:hypothetical protein